MKLLVVQLLVCVAVARVQAQNPEVQTSLDKIKGSVIKNRLGRDILSFRGVRYGKAPVGEMRFLPAEPVDSWPGTFDASQEGPACIKPGEKNYTENGLALNIYTIKLLSTSNSIKRPVIVFIHPGSFSVFSAQINIWGPQYLLDQDVVLVTINYSLAALGFISTDTHHAPGNLGLKDQVTALRFVRDHIASFGGDPGSVSLMGMSSGARSVIFHMLSPMSRGLFHRAVAMSGTAIRLEKLRTEMSDFALKQARLVNCMTQDLDEMFRCLKNVPAKKFSSTLSNFKLLKQKYLDSRDSSTLSQWTSSGLENSTTYRALVTGITKDEIIGTVYSALQLAKKGNSTYYDDLNAEWERVAPIIFQYNHEGVTHQDDLLYVFYISYRFPYFNATDPEIPMVEKMASLWANFARTGEPIPKNNKYFKVVTWKRVTPDNNNYLQINNAFKMKNNLYSDRYALWSKLFPLSPYKEPET